MFTRDAHRKVSPSTSVDGLTWPFGRCGSSHSGVSCTPCVKPLSSLKETREREGLPGVLEAKVGGKSPKASHPPELFPWGWALGGSAQGGCLASAPAGGHGGTDDTAPPKLHPSRAQCLDHAAAAGLFLQLAGGRQGFPPELP